MRLDIKKSALLMGELSEREELVYEAGYRAALLGIAGDEQECLISRILAIAETGERPAAERNGVDVSDYLRRFRESADAAGLKISATTIDEINNKVVEDLQRSATLIPTLPRKLSGFEEACEVAARGGLVSVTDDPIKKGFLIYREKEFHDGIGWQPFEHGSFSSNDAIWGDRYDWFEVADPSAVGGEGKS